MPSLRFLTCIAALLAVGCQTLEYDLSEVPVPVSAKSAEPGSAEVVPFEIDGTEILWVHGALGKGGVDVAELVAGEAQGYDRVAGFRVRQYTGFVDWLVTHVSLTLVRMKSVSIEGQLVRD